MARVKDNVITMGLSGRVSKTHQFRVMYGETWLAEMPSERTKPFTPEETARQEKFRQVAQQVRTELSDPVEKAKWEAQKGKYKTAYGAAFAFYYKQAGE